MLRLERVVREPSTEALPLAEGRRAAAAAHRDGREATSRSAPSGLSRSASGPAGCTSRPARRVAGPAAGLLPRRRLGVRRPRQPRPAVPVPGRAERRARAVGRLPARPGAPVPGGVRRRASRRTAGWSRTPPSLGADPDPARRRWRLRRRQPGRGHGDRGGARTGSRWRSSCWSTPALTDAAQEPVSRRLFGAGFYLTGEFMDRRRHQYLPDPSTVPDPRVSPLLAEVPAGSGAGVRRDRRASTRCATRARRTPGSWPRPGWRWSCGGSPTRSTASSTSWASAARRGPPRPRSRRGSPSDSGPDHRCLSRRAPGRPRPAPLRRTTASRRA